MKSSEWTLRSLFVLTASLSGWLFGFIVHWPTGHTPPHGAHAATLTAMWLLQMRFWLLGGLRRFDIWQAKHDRDGCSWGDVGSKAGRRKTRKHQMGRAGLGSSRGGTTVLFWIRSTTSPVLRRNKHQGGGMWRLSGKNHSRSSFYTMFEGIPDRKRWRQQQRAAGCLLC